MLVDNKHSFYIEDAEHHGVDKAVLLHSLRYWLTENKISKRNIRDGYVWTYDSAEALAIKFPYWTSNKIQKMLKVMENDGIIITGCFNSDKFNRKKWYSMPCYATELQNANTEVLNEPAQNEEQPPVKPPAKPEPKSKYKFTDDDLKFANLMHKKILEVNPAAPKVNIESWANDVRLMRERDIEPMQQRNGDTEPPHKAMWNVFVWANNDTEFWMNNIQSPVKLRKHFSALFQRMNSNAINIKPSQNNAIISGTEHMSKSKQRMYAARAERDAATANGQVLGCDGQSLLGTLD